MQERKPAARPSTSARKRRQRRPGSRRESASFRAAAEAARSGQAMPWAFQIRAMAGKSARLVEPYAGPGCDGLHVGDTVREVPLARCAIHNRRAVARHEGHAEVVPELSQGVGVEGDGAGVDGRQNGRALVREEEEVGGIHHAPVDGDAERIGRVPRHGDELEAMAAEGEGLGRGDRMTRREGRMALGPEAAVEGLLVGGMSPGLEPRQESQPVGVVGMVMGDDGLRRPRPDRLEMPKRLPEVFLVARVEEEGLSAIDQGKEVEPLEFPGGRVEHEDEESLS